MRVPRIPETPDLELLISTEFNAASIFDLDANVSELRAFLVEKLTVVKFAFQLEV